MTRHTRKKRDLSNESFLRDFQTLLKSSSSKQIELVKTKLESGNNELPLHFQHFFTTNESLIQMKKDELLGIIEEEGDPICRRWKARQIQTRGLNDKMTVPIIGNRGKTMKKSSSV